MWEGYYIKKRQIQLVKLLYVSVSLMQGEKWVDTSHIIFNQIIILSNAFYVFLSKPGASNNQQHLECIH